jgi:hypothetical protein
MKALPSLALAGLTTAAMAAFAAPAAAQAQGESAFTLRIGAMSADGDATLKGSANTPEQSVSGSQDFDFGSSEVSPRVDGVWKISDRNRLIFDYFHYDKDNTQTIGQDVSFGGYSVPGDTSLKLETKFQLASLVYDFAVIETENVSLGLELGAEWAKIDSTLSGDAGELGSFRESVEEDGIAPVAGLRFSAIPGEHWLINVQGQYLDADWGNFDYSGKIKRANATVEYKFTPNFGVFAGYDWFDIDYSEPYSSGDVTGRAGLELEFKGPMAGVTFAF